MANMTSKTLWLDSGPLDDERMMAALESVPDLRSYLSTRFDGETLDAVIGSLWQMGYVEVFIIISPFHIPRLCRDEKFVMRKIETWPDGSLRGWLHSCEVHGIPSMPKEQVLVIAADGTASKMLVV